jgi:hypothetical protein
MVQPRCLGFKAILLIIVSKRCVSGGVMGQQRGIFGAIVSKMGPFLPQLARTWGWRVGGKCQKLARDPFPAQIGAKSASQKAQCPQKPDSQKSAKITFSCSLCAQVKGSHLS